MFKKVFISIFAFTIVCWSLAWVFAAMAGETPKTTVLKLQSRLNQGQPLHEKDTLDLNEIDKISVGTQSVDVLVVTSENGPAVAEFAGTAEPGGKIIQIFKEGRELKIKLDQRHSSPVLLWNFEKDVKVEAFSGLKLTLPKQILQSLRVESLSGDITLRGLHARSLEFSTASGDIALEDCTVTESARIETKSGDVSVDDFQGNLASSSTSGDFLGQKISGDSLETRSTSGDIELKMFESGGLRAEATSGDISVALPEAKGWRFSLSASSGEIKNDFPEDPEGTKSMHIRSTSGDIRIHR